MPNAIIVVGKSPNNIHVVAAKYTAVRLTEEGYTPNFINTMATDNQDVLKYHMQQAKPELVVTLDCAGFDLDLLGGDLFYNSLCCPARHILLRPPFVFDGALRKRMNFTMDFYALGKSEAEYLERNYRRVPYSKVVEPVMGKASPDRKERQLGIMIAGTYFNPETVYDNMCICAGAYADEFADMADRLLEGRTDIYAIADETRSGRILLSEKPDAAILAIEYARVRRLKDIADALIRINIPFAVCAPGWKENFNYTGLICISEQELMAEQLMQVYGMSAIVIDCNPGRPDICPVPAMMASACGAETMNVTKWSESDFYKKLLEIV